MSCIGAMLRILIADDHALVREGLKQILAASGIACIVGEACNGLEAFEMGLVDPWDIVLLDISMPFENGISVLRRLLNRKPGLRAIILSMHVGAIYVKHALKAGAVGYIIKEAAPYELLDAIAQVLKGGKYLSQGLPDLPDTGDLPPLATLDS
jgi:two-component system invasion response regulator UvrY